MDLEGTTALVTGAGGFIGRCLVTRLSEAGVHVRMLLRDHARIGSIAQSGQKAVLGDVTIPSTLVEAVRGCDLVFHCAALGGGNLSEARTVNVVGTENLMRASLEAGVRRVVHVSSVAVHGTDLPSLVVEEQALVTEGDSYSVSKAEGEKVALSYSGRNGLEVVVVRPTCVYGPSSPTWVMAPFGRVRYEQILLIGNGAGVINLVYVDDLVDLLLLAAASVQASGQCIFASGERPVTWREYLGAFAQMQGKPLPPSVDRRWARLLAPAALWRYRFTRKPIKLAPWDIAQQTHSAWFSIEKARRVLGYEPRIQFEEGMRRVEEWLGANGYLRREVDTETRRQLSGTSKLCE